MTLEDFKNYKDYEDRINQFMLNQQSKIDDMLLIADHRFNLLQEEKEIVKSQQSKIEELEKEIRRMQHCNNCGRLPSEICDSCILCSFKESTREVNSWVGGPKCKQ